MGSTQRILFSRPKGQGRNPVLLVHDWGGQASPYGNWSIELTTPGARCSFLTSAVMAAATHTPMFAAMEENSIIARMSKRDVEAIISLDLEKAKSFLKDENNKENLNFNALVVIGVREGCVMAAHWAAARS